MIRVLILDGVGPFGGASRSLYEALRALPAGTVEVYFVTAAGTVEPYYREVAVDVLATRGLTRFDNTRYSHYRGVRWLVLLREVAHLPFTLAALWRARRRWRSVDVIHANEITEILPLLLAKWLFGAPTIVHVRSLQRQEPRSIRTRLLAWLLRRSVDGVIAIDENVRATLPADVPVDVIHNSFTPKRLDRPDARLLERLRALRPGSLKVGFVGNLHRSKGIFDLFEAAHLVRKSGRDVEYLILGGATHRVRGVRAWLLARLGLAQDVSAEVERERARLGIEEVVHLLGPSPDIQLAFDNMDVLCFPSHFDAPGRPVFEAAFSAVPSIVAVTSPRPDTLIPGETGLAVPGESPVLLAEAIQYLCDNRSEVARMGANARRLAETNFEPARNALKLLAVYERVASPTPAAPSPPA